MANGFEDIKISKIPFIMKDYNYMTVAEDSGRNALVSFLSESEVLGLQQ